MTLSDFTNNQTYDAQTGDVALLQGTSLIVGGAIRDEKEKLFTGSPWTHAGFVYVDLNGGHPWIIEAVSAGVVKSEVVDFVGTYKVMVRRPARSFTDEEIADMTKVALAMVGHTKYSTSHLLSGALWAVFGKPNESNDLPLGTVPDAVDCAEGVAIIERNGGFDPVPGIAARAVTPAELATTPLMSTVVNLLAVQE